MAVLDNDTVYCHLVDRNDADNLIIPGTLTVGGAAVLAGAPVTVDSASITLAADLHAALVTLGLVVDAA